MSRLPPRYKYLFGASGAVLAVWGILSVSDVSNVIDTIGLFALLIASLMVVSTMLRDTQEWNLRSASILFLFVGTGISLVNRLFAVVFREGDRPDAIVDLARSFLVVGATLLVFAFIWHLVKQSPSHDPDHR